MKTYNNTKIDKSPGIKTNIPMFDKFISADGGIYRGTVIFLTGTSGAGKTTLSKVIQRGLSDYKTALYERETSAKAVARQLKNIKIHDNAFLADDSKGQNLTQFLKEAKDEKMTLIIIDSMQTAAIEFIMQGKNKEAAELEVYNVLNQWRKETNGIVILIGHVTKEGDFAGGNTVKQLSDAHVHMVFDKKTNLRWMESSKNRMGEIGKIFYKFVNNEKVLEFYEKNDEQSQDIINHNDKEFDEAIAFFESFNNKKDKNSIMFIEECTAWINMFQRDFKNTTVLKKNIVTIINELKAKYF